MNKIKIISYVIKQSFYHGNLYFMDYYTLKLNVDNKLDIR